MKSNKESKTLTVKDWLNALNISINTFKKLKNNGIIPPPLPLGGRCQRWPVADLDNVLSRI
jgi:predicted DNA-binding transcriptional regulator AlpA